MTLLGIDTGGTFTDFVLFDGKAFRTHKVLSTPAAPEKAILQGIHDLGIALSNTLAIIHGSTVATNALLEGKGATTAYIANRGFKDVLSIGRQARKELYNLTPQPESPPVPLSHCLEIGGRINAQGKVLEPLNDNDIQELLGQIKSLAPQAIAINLLFSYLDPRFEQKIAKAIPENIFVSCSSDILPVYREYERGITTWLNAYVGPVMQGYLTRLTSHLKGGRLSIMRSSGQTCDHEQAGREAVHLLLSGPAGGIKAADSLATNLGIDKLLTFDMGGTSTDVAMIDAEIELTGEGHIAGYPVGVPMVNIHTIGAGGGSIAYVDDGGLLQVGPESAGAVPGPACYGQGGEAATVTDANLVLGRIPQDITFGESLPADYDKAEQAISQLANNLRLPSIEAAALGIIRIANEHMAQALRVISVERGIDPRRFVLMAFGGAGGLHVCELAEKLGIEQAIVPGHAGVLSALGMLVAEPGRQLTQTLGRLLSDTSESHIEEIIVGLQQQGSLALRNEGHLPEKMVYEAGLDLCYRGQAHTLQVPWTDKQTSAELFQQQHEERYGHRLDSPLELVNVRVGIWVKQYTILNSGTNYACEEYAKEKHRYSLLPGGQVMGETIICESGSTIWVAPGWFAERDMQGNIRLTRRNE